MRSKTLPGLNPAIRHLLAFSAVIFHAGASANLLDCVDPEVIATFLTPQAMVGSAASTVPAPRPAAPVISRQLPDGFIAFDPPRGFALIGGSTAANRLVGAYRTPSRDVDGAIDAVTDALAAVGFERQRSHTGTTPGQVASGFQSTRSGNLTALCRRPDGPLAYVGATLPARGADKGADHGTIVTVVQHPGTSCAALDLLAASNNRFLPALDIPATSRLMGQDTTLHDQAATTSARFRIDWSVDRLMRFFDRQIAGQNYRREGEWQTPFAQASVWTRDLTDGYVSATLTLLAHGNDEFSARFSLWMSQ